MTIEASYRQDGLSLDYTPSAATLAGAVVQLPDGRAGVPANDIEASQLGAAAVRGLFVVQKTAGQVWLPGCEIWWDHSANKAMLRPPGGGSDRDFFIGTAWLDATSAATTGTVILNERAQSIVDLNSDAFDHVPVLTAGTPTLRNVGGNVLAQFSATAEAQKLDLLSRRSWPVSANWILEAVVNVVTDADADVADLNVGVANGTHASDADSIAESCFFHFDMGADLNLDAESDDGTTEVAAIDTTLDWAVGTPVHLMIDGRDHTDIQMYVNGALVLGGSTFTLEDATGPIKALFHFEKSANDSPGIVSLDRLCVRLAE